MSDETPALNPDKIDELEHTLYTLIDNYKKLDKPQDQILANFVANEFFSQLDVFNEEVAQTLRSRYYILTDQVYLPPALFE